MSRFGHADGALHADTPTARYRRYLPASGGGRVGTGAGRPIPTTGGPVAEPTEPDTPPVVVGVIDTGLVTAGGIHPYLRGRATRLREALDEDPLPEPGLECGDQHGHGSFVCGVILRNAPQAKILVRRALLDENRADGNAEDAAVVNAIKELVDAGARVINLSFRGVDPEEGHEPLTIRDAMQAAAARGVLMVAAAGNDPGGARCYPAEFADPEHDTDPSCRLSEHVVAVSAVDETLTGPEPDFTKDPPPPPLASFSAVRAWVHACANGVNVLGPWAGGAADLPESQRWARATGSSFATAIVTGRIVSAAQATRVTPLEAASALQLFGTGATDPVYLVGADSPGCHRY